MTDVSLRSGPSAAVPPVIDTRGGFSGPAGFTTRPVIRGFHGVVAAGHYAAAEVGMRVLEAGGNAIDAGVASVFALTLLKPQSAGIGGECPVLVYHHSPDPSLPNPVAISGQGVAPRRATIAWFREQGTPDQPGGMTRAAGEHFRRELLGRGGSIEALETYRRFRGRDPEVSHLLARLGLG